MFFLSCVCYAFCKRLFICVLWSPAGKGLNSWLSFVVSNCEFITFPLESWVRRGTYLYRFLIFAPLLTLRVVKILNCNFKMPFISLTFAEMTNQNSLVIFKTHIRHHL